MSRLRPTGKAAVVILGVLGAGLLVVSASRTWVAGTVDDAVLGASRVSATGSQVVPGLVALALVAAAGAIASTTSGAVTRRVTLVVVLLAGLAEAALTLRVLHGPAGALGSVAAASTGRTGSIETHSTATAWPWVALVAAAAVLLAGVLGWVGARKWRGLGARYETTADAPEAHRRGARGERVASDWDRLDAGDDPTIHDDDSTA